MYILRLLRRCDGGYYRNTARLCLPICLLLRICRHICRYLWIVAWHGCVALNGIWRGSEAAVIPNNDLSLPCQRSIKWLTPFSSFPPLTSFFSRISLDITCDSLSCKYDLTLKMQASHWSCCFVAGIPFQMLYQKCRENFLVNSDQTLRTQLTEFRDHKLIKSRKVLSHPSIIIFTLYIIILPF